MHNFYSTSFFQITYFHHSKTSNTPLLPHMLPLSQKTTTITPNSDLDSEYKWKYHGGELHGEAWLEEEYHGIVTLDQMIDVIGVNFTSRLTHCITTSSPHITHHTHRHLLRTAQHNNHGLPTTAKTQSHHQRSFSCTRYFFIPTRARILGIKLVASRH